MPVMSGARVRITLVSGTKIEGELDRTPRFDTYQTGAVYYVKGLGKIDPYAIESVDVLEGPRPLDEFGDGTVCYAVNNGYHHVWVKSGGRWYTANRAGTTSWEHILLHCKRWEMNLYRLDAPSHTDCLYSPTGRMR